MAQVGLNKNLFHKGFAALDLERLLVQGEVQREGGTILILFERKDVHHLGGQHGDFVARHVHRGEPGPGKGVKSFTGLKAQCGRRNVNA